MIIFLNTQTEAQKVLDALSKLIHSNKDRIITLGQLRRLLDEEVTYQDHMLGWASLRDAVIDLDESKTCWTLTLPEPIEVAAIMTDRVMSIILEGK
jgi:endonuclease V-like protein UPF0215 family